MRNVINSKKLLASLVVGLTLFGAASFAAAHNMTIPFFDSVFRGHANITNSHKNIQACDDRADGRSFSAFFVASDGVTPLSARSTASVNGTCGAVIQTSFLNKKARLCSGSSCQTADVY